MKLSLTRLGASLALALVVAGTGAFGTTAKAQSMPAPDGARVYLSSLAPGSDIMTDTVHFKMNVEGMTVAAAGSDDPNSGHFHILINTELENTDEPIPSDENHIHFGAGETEGFLKMQPGEYTVQLVFADTNHIPHDPVIATEPITIRVLPAQFVGYGGRSFWYGF